LGILGVGGRAWNKRTASAANTLTARRARRARVVYLEKPMMKVNCLVGRGNGVVENRRRSWREGQGKFMVF
jgi:hypothetical protein